MSRPLVPRFERSVAAVFVAAALLAADDPDDLVVFGLAATPFLALAIGDALALRIER